MGLRRSLSLFGASMLVVGSVVGAGIFTTSSTLAKQVTDPFSFLLIWVLGGLLTLTGALTYAELGAMFPRAGGDYQFLKEAYGPLAGFLIGWLNFWVISPGSIAALSIAFVSYLPLPASALGGALPKLLAVLLILVLSGMSYRSTRLASSTQAITTIGNLLLLVGLVVFGAIFGHGDAGRVFSSPSSEASPLALFGPAMIAVLFTYSGWYAAAYVGSEVIDPGRNVPRALIGGTAIVTVLYTAVNGIYLYAMPIAEIRSVANVAHGAAVRLFGQPVAVVISVAILLAIGSCINAAIITGPRIFFAMAEDRLFPARFGRVHARFNTPYQAIVVQGLLAVVMVILGSFDRLLGYVVFAMLLACIATALAHIVLRVRRPDLERPYRTFGYPVLPLLFVGAYAWIASSIAAQNPGSSLLGIGFALTGVPFYFWARPRTP